MNHVLFANVPARNSHQLSEAIKAAFHGELCLVCSESTESTAHGVVGAHCHRGNVYRRRVIRTSGMTCCSFEDFHSNRCVRTRVANHACAYRSEFASSITTDGVLHTNGVTFGVHQQTLFARQCALHRLLHQPCSQSGLSLVRHVFFAAKGATVRNQFHRDGLCRNVQDGTDLIAVVPDALTTGVHMHCAIRGIGYCEC